MGKMIITVSAYNKIYNSISENPPEMGGIIGSSDDNIINEVVIDFPTFPVENYCSYTPNVDFLNREIETWRKNGIFFKGIFHTHFAGVKTLLSADKHYIQLIMNSMPTEIKYLYLPIYVLPDRKFSGYIAKKQFKDIQILFDEVIVE